MLGISEEQQVFENGKDLMWPSLNSIKNFFTVNTILCGFSAIEYAVAGKTTSLIPLAALCIVKNIAMMENINFFTQDKPWIDSERRKEPVEKYKGEFVLNLVRTSLIEAGSKFVVYNWVFHPKSHFVVDTLLFVPYSFVFEVIFDFFHYWSHRLLHQVPFLYKNVHKHHHAHPYPISIIAFYQSPLDLFLTNCLPTFATFLLLPGASHWTLALLFTHKTHIEICGHTGKHVGRTSSFHQFIWLPRVLGMELYTEQHDKHHSLNNCNYAKRFALWDKVFGTYKQ